MLQYKMMSGATATHRYALTLGTAEGRAVRGHFGTAAMTPMPGLCATSYRVRAILTEGNGQDLTHYGVPVYRGSFTFANMREVERRIASATALLRETTTLKGDNPCPSQLLASSASPKAS